MNARNDATGASSQTKFAWPPAPLKDIAPIASAGAPATTQTVRTPGPIRSALQTCESFWLAPTAIPIQRRMAEIAWTPDAPGDYCDRCGMTIGPFESDEFGCADCRGEPIAWTRFVRLGEYGGDLADWIIDLKFRGRRHIAQELGTRLAHVARDAGFPLRSSAVAPIAMARSRRFVRPFDHALEIARPAAHALGVPLVHAFRRKRRPSQRSVPASKRRANVRGSFVPRRGVDFTGWSVLLIDDVRTTGATMGEAARTLRRMGVGEIWAAVVAVTPGRARRTGGGDSPSPDTPR